MACNIVEYNTSFANIECAGLANRTFFFHRQFSKQSAFINFYFSGYPKDWTWNFNILAKILISLFIQSIRILMKSTSKKSSHIQRKSVSEYYTERDECLPLVFVQQKLYKIHIYKVQVFSTNWACSLWNWKSPCRASAHCE